MNRKTEQKYSKQKIISFNSKNGSIRGSPDNNHYKLKKIKAFLTI